MDDIIEQVGRESIIDGISDSRWVFEEEDAPDPLKRHFMIYCDESGMDGGFWYGFGSLWMTWERRGDFQAMWKDLHERHYPPSEVKWTKIKKRTVDFFLDLVDCFFDRKWLMFHCIVLCKNQVNLKCHHNSWDLARRKHFTMLLARKIKRYAAAGKQYRIRVDPIHSSYKKADEAIETILRRTVVQAVGISAHDIIHSVKTVDSAQTPGIQLADVLLGAVMAARRNQVESEAKIAVMQRIAERLGWPDLSADTMPNCDKFNIWRFWDPTSNTPRPGEDQTGFGMNHLTGGGTVLSCTR